MVHGVETSRTVVGSEFQISGADAGNFAFRILLFLMLLYCICCWSAIEEEKRQSTSS